MPGSGTLRRRKLLPTLTRCEAAHSPCVLCACMSPSATTSLSASLVLMLALTRGRSAQQRFKRQGLSWWGYRGCTALQPRSQGLICDT